MENDKNKVEKNNSGKKRWWRTRPRDGRGHGNNFAANKIDKTGTMSNERGHRQLRLRNTICGVEDNAEAD